MKSINTPIFPTKFDPTPLAKRHLVDMGLLCQRLGVHRYLWRGESDIEQVLTGLSAMELYALDTYETEVYDNRIVDVSFRWDVIRVTILAFFGSLEVFLEGSFVACYGIMQDFFDESHENEDVHAFLHQAWFYKGFDQLVIGLALTLSLSAISSWFVVPFSALVLLAPFLDMDCLMDSYLLIQEGFAFEFKIWTTFFDISWSIGADICMIADLAVWTRFWTCNRTFNIDTDTDDIIIKKKFSIVDSGKFVLIVCKWGGQFYGFAKGVWNNFKTVSRLVDISYQGVLIDFVDNLCRDSHVDLMGNLVPLLMILEIGHRCDDFEYMVLL
ncbi:hypothetical protein Tco_1246467 [Tanacetum coccineum]